MAKARINLLYNSKVNDLKHLSIFLYKNDQNAIDLSFPELKYFKQIIYNKSCNFTSLFIILRKYLFPIYTTFDIVKCSSLMKMLFMSSFIINVIEEGVLNNRKIVPMAFNEYCILFLLECYDLIICLKSI